MITETVRAASEDTPEDTLEAASEDDNEDQDAWSHPHCDFNPTKTNTNKSQIPSPQDRQPKHDFAALSFLTAERSAHHGKRRKRIQLASSTDSRS